MKTYFSLFAALSIFFAQTAAAQELTLLPEGQTLISLAVTERSDVQQDTLHASLRIEQQDKNATDVQNKVNAAVKAALDLAKPYKDIKASTGYYSVYQTYADPNNPRSVKAWHGSQSIELESKDAQALLELAGKIQEKGFATNNLSYSLSVEKADEIRESLLENALTRAKAKAERAAKGLGKASVELVQVDVDNVEDGFRPPVAFRSAKAEMSSADFAAPVATAGETSVSLTVRVRAIAK